MGATIDEGELLGGVRSYLPRYVILVYMLRKTVQMGMNG